MSRPSRDNMILVGTATRLLTRMSTTQSVAEVKECFRKLSKVAKTIKENNIRELNE